MEIKIYKYLVIIIVFVLLICSYFFYPFVKTFNSNTGTIFTVIIFLMELNLLSIYWTLSNYDKNKNKIGQKGDTGEKGIPGKGGDPEICDVCATDNKSTTTTKKPVKENVLLEIKVLTSNSEDGINSQIKQNKDFQQVFSKNITFSSEREYDALIGRFGKEDKDNKKITNLVVINSNDNCVNSEEVLETSNENIKICVVRNNTDPGITSSQIKIVNEAPDKKSIPLNQINGDEVNLLYLKIEK